MNKSMIIAQKEWKDINRSRVFLSMAGLLILLTLMSISISFAVFNSQFTEYQSAIQFLKTLGKASAATVPPLYPLNLLRGGVDYVEIIGAIVGIILGYISMAKEKNSKSVRLIFSRPVSRRNVVNGKVAGNTLFVLLLMAMIALTIITAISFTTGAFPDTVELVKIGLFTIFSTIYIMVFFLISFFFTMQQKNSANGLIISFIIWLLFVLLLPQIGDTMDPDNQVPGGFFKSMQIDRVQEKEIMANFSGYESVRSSVEQLSITKHYERLSFALFGIKQIYNTMPLRQILQENLGNIIWLLAAIALIYTACFILTIRNNNYLGRE